MGTQAQGRQGATGAGAGGAGTASCEVPPQIILGSETLVHATSSSLSSQLGARTRIGALEIILGGITVLRPT